MFDARLIVTANNVNGDFNNSEDINDSCNNVRKKCRPIGKLI